LLTVILTANINARSSNVDLSFNTIPLTGSGYVEIFVLQTDDKITDIAVFRSSNGTWYLQPSIEGFAAYLFGFQDDVLTPDVYIR